MLKMGKHAIWFLKYEWKSIRNDYIRVKWLQSIAYLCGHSHLIFIPGLLLLYVRQFLVLEFLYYFADITFRNII